MRSVYKKYCLRKNDLKADITGRTGPASAGFFDHTPMSAFGCKADITGSPGPASMGLFLLTLPNVSGCSSLPVAPGPVCSVGHLLRLALAESPGL